MATSAHCHSASQVQRFARGCWCQSYTPAKLTGKAHWLTWRCGALPGAQASGRAGAAGCGCGCRNGCRGCASGCRTGCRSGCCRTCAGAQAHTVHTHNPQQIRQDLNVDLPCKEGKMHVSPAQTSCRVQQPRSELCTQWTQTTGACKAMDTARASPGPAAAPCCRGAAPQRGAGPAAATAAAVGGPARRVTPLRGG